MRAAVKAWSRGRGFTEETLRFCAGRRVTNVKKINHRNKSALKHSTIISFIFCLSVGWSEMCCIHYVARKQYLMNILHNQRSNVLTVEFIVLSRWRCKRCCTLIYRLHHHFHYFSSTWLFTLFYVYQLVMETQWNGQYQGCMRLGMSIPMYSTIFLAEQTHYGSSVWHCMNFGPFYTLSDVMLDDVSF